MSEPRVSVLRPQATMRKFLPSPALLNSPGCDGPQARVIELRFFGGLSMEETAEVLHVSPDTVKRDWRLAKAWLLRELRGDEGTRQEAREK